MHKGQKSLHTSKQVMQDLVFYHSNHGTSRAV